MTSCCMISVAAVALGVTIFVIAFMFTIFGPRFGYVVLGITLTLAILAAVWFFYWRKKRHSPPTSLLPTSAQQAGDASDIRRPPDGNPPPFTLDQGRENKRVPRRPPPVVTWGRDNRGSYLGHPVIHSESPTSLLPRYMDGGDG